MLFPNRPGADGTDETRGPRVVRWDVFYLARGEIVLSANLLSTLKYGATPLEDPDFRLLVRK